MTYEVAMPIISGWQVVKVEAESEEDAKEKAGQGEFDTFDTEYDKLEVDTDSNNWEVSEE